MVCFQTKYPTLGKFWWALEWKMLVYFMVNRYSYGHLVMLWKFGIFPLVLVYCVNKNLASLVSVRNGGNQWHDMKKMTWYVEGETGKHKRESTIMMSRNRRAHKKWEQTFSSFLDIFLICPFLIFLTTSSLKG
jgi:hypothetical protein